MKLPLFILIWTVAYLALPTPAAEGSPLLMVTKADDTADGMCDADCSLREAIMFANITPGEQVVILPFGTYTLAIQGMDEDLGATGDLDITDDLMISGGIAFHTIIEACDSNAGPCRGVDRVFDIDPGASGVNATFAEITIRNGSTSPPKSGLGGGILNKGNLTIFGSGIYANEASAGGGIFNTGSISITRTSVNENRASDAGGGIYSEGQAALFDVTIDSNVSGFNGGGMTLLGTAVVTNSYVSRNSTGDLGLGGSIQHSGFLTVESTTVVNNVGGGVAGGGIYSSGNVVVNNSTIRGSDSTALFVGTPGPNGSSAPNVAQLTNVTISGNGGGLSVASDGDLVAASTTIAFNGYGIRNDSGGRASIKDTIVSDNLGGNCSGPIASSGHNLEDSNTCGLAGGGDLPNTDPQLGQLGNNGGRTMTHELWSGSNAVDRGSDSCPLRDQRNTVRTQDGDSDGLKVCDIGAFEYCPSPVGNADCDSFATTSENACGSDDERVESIPERMDLAGDDNQDGSINEGLPAGAEAYDCDGDGFMGGSEVHVTTSDQDPCGNNGWPGELFSVGESANRLTLTDLSSFIAPEPRKLNTDPADGGYNLRWDVVPGNGAGAPKDINLQDVSALTAPSPSVATSHPPMLGGAHAFGGPVCPWPP